MCIFYTCAAGNGLNRMACSLSICIWHLLVSVYSVHKAVSNMAVTDYLNAVANFIWVIVHFKACLCRQSLSYWGLSTLISCRDRHISQTPNAYTIHCLHVQWCGTKKDYSCSNMVSVAIDSTPILERV